MTDMTIQLVAEAQGKNLVAAAYAASGVIVVLRDWTRPNYEAYSVGILHSYAATNVTNDTTKEKAMGIFTAYLSQ